MSLVYELLLLAGPDNYDEKKLHRTHGSTRGRQRDTG